MYTKAYFKIVQTVYFLNLDPQLNSEPSDTLND